ncbi:MAG: HAMP domain-containing sensor histidine kinase [Minwuia sp.]|nr:HAMP domain-containing sensor histidine kinase [Minwuia sp.]
MNVTRTIILTAAFAVACFGFFGFITYQNTEALSTVRQQTVLRSITEMVIGDAAGQDSSVWQSSAWLSERPALATGDLLAIVVGADGQIVSESRDTDNKSHSLPVATILSWDENRKSHEQRINDPGCRWVWVSAPLPGTDKTLVLVHASFDGGISQLADLYIVPTAIAILIIIWSLVWVRLSMLRRVSIMARQEQLEVELVREQEASRIKSAFLANMSHELRTPLNAITGFAQMLRNETFGPLGSAKNTEYVGIIHDSGSHLSRLIGHVLDLSQVESGSADLQESEIIPAELFDECQTLVRGVIESRDQNITCSIGNDIGRVSGDKLRLTQVLVNLLSNAAKFSPRNSTIRLQARLQSNGDLLLQVIDKGRGIAAEDIAKVLQPFGQAEVSADTARDGTGLGLPISLALMELHGGSLTICSQPGLGTTVTARLPANRHLAPAQDVFAQAAPAKAANL